MQKDNRDRNSYFKSTEISRYLKEYAYAMAACLNKVDDSEIEKAHLLLRNVLAWNGRIFVAGNGGSAAIADHLTCDFSKGTHTDKRNGFFVHSLVGSMAIFSALANDDGYEQTFSKQLEMAQITSKDCVILISSSGNSPNIVAAMMMAHSVNASVIGLTGFDGGELRKRANIKLHVQYNNYGIVEDCHQAIMHVLAQFHYVGMK